MINSGKHRLATLLALCCIAASCHRAVSLRRQVPPKVAVPKGAHVRIDPFQGKGEQQLTASLLRAFESIKRFRVIDGRLSKGATADFVVSGTMLQYVDSSEDDGFVEAFVDFQDGFTGRRIFGKRVKSGIGDIGAATEVVTRRVVRDFVPVTKRSDIDLAFVPPRLPRTADPDSPKEAARWTQVVAELQQALDNAQDPDDRTALQHNLGMALAFVGRLEEAAAALQVAASTARGSMATRVRRNQELVARMSRERATFAKMGRDRQALASRRKMGRASELPKGGEQPTAEPAPVRVHLTTGAGAANAPAWSFVVPRARVEGHELHLGAVLSDVAVSELSRLPWAANVMGASDIDAVLTAERDRDLLNCDDIRCLSEIGNALDARFTLLVKVGRVGTTTRVAIDVIDALTIRAVARSDTSIDGDVEKLPAAVERVVRQVAMELHRELQ